MTASPGAAARQRWQDLTIKDDFVFSKVMLDQDLCRDVLCLVLGVDIERVEYLSRQEQIDASPSGKGIRLDVYVRDGKGSVYDVEMQAVDTHELPQRALYYHALMALDRIERGRPYRDLGNSYVIFVCGFDPFSQGKRVYSFQNNCLEVPDLVLGDGTKTVFLSSSSPRDGGPIDEFLDYVGGGSVSGGLSQRLERRVAEVLSSEKWRLEYMKLEVRDQLKYAEGMEQGIKQGLADSRLQLAELSRLMERDGRLAELPDALGETDVLERLLKEYGIE